MTENAYILLCFFSNQIIKLAPASSLLFIPIAALSGSVQAVCIMESIMEQVAEVLGMDPLELKTLNLYNKGDVSIVLTHWGRVTHICVGNLTIIGSDNGLSPDRRQAIIWNNAGILLIRPLGTNFSEMLIEILTFSFKKIHLKMSSGKWRPFCLGLNVLTHCFPVMSYLLLQTLYNIAWSKQWLVILHHQAMTLSNP